MSARIEGASVGSFAGVAGAAMLTTESRGLLTTPGRRRLRAPTPVYVDDPKQIFKLKVETRVLLHFVNIAARAEPDAPGMLGESV
jgi:hypothetical protein